MRRATALAEFHHQLDPALRYQHEAGVVREREIAVVKARARVVRGVKEFVRISSLVPFPMQSWLLAVPEQGRAKLSPGFFVNLPIALLSLCCALLGSNLALSVHPFWSALEIVAIPLQIVGGICYYYTRTHEPAFPSLVKSLWRLQILFLFAGGVLTTAMASWREGRLVLMRASFSWLILGLWFVVGLYVFEYMNRRWWSVASLDESSPR